MMLSHHFIPGNNLSLNDHCENVPGTVMSSPSMVGSMGRFAVAASKTSGATSFKALILASVVIDVNPSLAIAAA